MYLYDNWKRNILFFIVMNPQALCNSLKQHRDLKGTLNTGRLRALDFLAQPLNLAAISAENHSL